MGGQKQRAGLFAERVHAHPLVYRMAPLRDEGAQRSSNCYVIKSGREALLVDAGMPEFEVCRCQGEVQVRAVDRANLLRSMAAFLADVDEVSLFLSHLHLDHVGSAPGFLDIIDRVYVGGIEWEAYAQRDYRECKADLHAMGLSEKEVSVSVENLKAADMFAREFIAALEDRKDRHQGPHVQKVAPGDCIGVGDATFEVIDASGHTAGHLALYHRASGLLLSGDAVLLGVAPSVDHSAGFVDGMRKTLETLERFSTLPFKALCPGHGQIMEEASARLRIERMLAHHRTRLGQVRNIVAEIPGLSSAEVAARVPWMHPTKGRDDYRKAAMLVNVTAMLAYLVEEECLACRHDACGVARYWNRQGNEMGQK